MGNEEMESTDLKGNELVLAGADDADLILAGKKGNIDPGTTQARKEFISRIGEMDPKIGKMLKSGKLQLCEQIIYTTVDLPIGTANVDVFKEDDDIAIGIRNIAKSKLEVGRPLVVSEIVVAFSASAANAFASVQYTPEFARGEVDLVYNSFKVFEKTPILGAFSPIVSGYGVNEKYGRYKLNNPKLFLDDKRIEMTMKWPAASAAIASIKVMLIGISVRPYSKA